MIQLR